ncbi:MAG: hypothetical protein ACI4QR_05735 [Eubacteriales bacterium]
MKKNIFVAVAITVVLLVLVCILMLFIIPAHFLGAVDEGDIVHITVRDGGTGAIFEIDDRDDISFIVGKIKERTFRRDGISSFRMGTRFTLSFYDTNGKKISEFIVNSDNTIRKDPFFYRADESMDVVDFLEDLENKAE